MFIKQKIKNKRALPPIKVKMHLIIFYIYNHIYVPLCLINYGLSSFHDQCHHIIIYVFCSPQVPGRILQMKSRENLADNPLHTFFSSLSLIRGKGPFRNSINTFNFLFIYISNIRKENL